MYTWNSLWAPNSAFRDNNMKLVHEINYGGTQRKSSRNHGNYWYKYCDRWRIRLEEPLEPNTVSNEVIRELFPKGSDGASRIATKLKSIKKLVLCEKKFIEMLDKKFTTINNIYGRKKSIKVLIKMNQHRVLELEVSCLSPFLPWWNMRTLQQRQDRCLFPYIC